MKLFPISTFAFAVLVFISGCDKSTGDNPSGKYKNDVFIVNEGPYPTGTGTISAFNRETGEITHDLFESVNGRPLGSVVQSMSIYGDRAFISVNNANKVEVVNLEDFKSVATIENITLPRYFIAVSEEKGYVSCWDSTVKVIDLNDYSVIKSIPAGIGPDEMILYNDALFVINSGGFGSDNRISAINTTTDELMRHINVGDRPASIVMDAQNTIWVLCSGKGWNGFPDPSDTYGRLMRISPSTYEILSDIYFEDTDIHPDNLVVEENGAVMYYNTPLGIHKFSVAFGYIDSQPFINSGKMYYGLGYDKTGGLIYAADPLDFSQNGWVYLYDHIDGTRIDSVKAGLGPNGVCFND